LPVLQKILRKSYSILKFIITPKLTNSRVAVAKKYDNFNT
jgi:hypothetical protein